GRSEEIRDDHDHAALAQEILKVQQRLGVVRTRAWLRIFKAAQQTIKLALARGGTYISAHFVVKNDQTRGVALCLRREVKKRRRDVPRVLDFLDLVRGVIHGAAGVQEYRQQRVRFAAVAFQVSAFGSREDVPVHVTQVVTRGVGAI